MTHKEAPPLMTSNAAGPADPRRTTMSDLTEFLLARIAEDEAVADGESDGGWRPGLTIGIADRMSAECEAKRRIVDRATGWLWPEDETRWTLCRLASVYSDHPDYDEEWKP